MDTDFKVRTDYAYIIVRATVMSRGQIALLNKIKWMNLLDAPFFKQALPPYLFNVTDTDVATYSYYLPPVWFNMTESDGYELIVRQPSFVYYNHGDRKFTVLRDSLKENKQDLMQLNFTLHQGGLTSDIITI